MRATEQKLILSIFPGIDLLGRAFEDEGYCVVRGPDLLWGGDIRKFQPPEGVFWGVIGGSPCQDFSGLRRDAPTGYGREMLSEFARCVTLASPEWWLLENVARVPNVTIRGYKWQRFDIDQGWYESTRRLRHIQFGSRSGVLLDIERRSVTPEAQGAILANDGRGWRDMARSQGLPDDWDLPGFTVKAKKRAIGNAVPYSMGRVLAWSVTKAFTLGASRDRGCRCGCGRRVTGKRLYYDFSCRKRAQRNRERAVSRRDVTEPGHSRE